MCCLKCNNIKNYVVDSSIVFFLLFLMLFLWFLKRFFHGFVFLSITSETRETISRKYLTTRYFPPYYFFFFSFFFFLLLNYFSYLEMTALVVVTHTCFSLSNITVQRRDFWWHACKKNHTIMWRPSFASLFLNASSHCGPSISLQ